MFTDEITAMIAKAADDRKTQARAGGLVCVDGADREAGLALCEAAKAHERCQMWPKVSRYAEQSTFNLYLPPEAELCERVMYARRRHRNIAGLIDRGFPERILVAAYDRKLDETEAYRAAIDFTHSNLTFLVLLGGKGTGKTTAAVAAGCRVQGARFLKAHRITRLDRFDDDAMALVEDCPFLVLDDLGVEYLDVKGEAASRLDALLDERYDGGRKTVVTSNLNASDFTSRYGERVADRFREAGRTVNLTGESMRKRP